MSRGQTERLTWGVVSRGIYKPVKRHAGIFSLCSTSLEDLATTKNAIWHVSARRAFHEFRTVPGRNSWSVYFQQPNGRATQPEPDPYVERQHHHDEYRALKFDSFEPFVRHYFSPSKAVRKRVRYFRDKYSLDGERLIAVNIRGTDKYTEVPPAPVEHYLELAVRAQSVNSSSRVLLVTDQTQFMEPFRAEFGNRLVVFGELPTTTSNESIHPALKVRERQRFGLDFMAAIRIIASAKTVITHTGNGAFWTALFRGNTSGLVQLHGSNQFGEV